MMHIGILGGGLSGVTCQRFLKHKSEILEKQDRVGGLCRSFEKQGFRYDIGGHILFSQKKEILETVESVLGKNINRCKRNNKIYIKNRFMKYPFENELSALDKQDIYDCLLGYLKNDYPSPENFYEWIYYTFGKGIADLYLIPYNEKIWKESLKNMNMAWVERIPKPPLEDLLKSAIGISTEGYLHQLYFNYPALGGIEGLIQSMLKSDSQISAGFEVRKIVKKGREWVVSNGNINKYFDKLILTLPIKEAVKCLENVPDNVLTAACALRHNAVRVVLVGVNNESLMDKSAVYFPEQGAVFHRACYMGYFSKNNVPPSSSSLVAEVTTHENHELYKVTDDALVEMVVRDLTRTGLVQKNEISVTDTYSAEYGYVVYDSAYSKNIKIVKDYFSSLDIELLGRSAEFEYINMDEVIRRSINVANKFNGMVEF